MKVTDEEIFSEKVEVTTESYKGERHPIGNPNRKVKCIKFS